MLHYPSNKVLFVFYCMASTVGAKHGSAASNWSSSGRKHNDASTEAVSLAACEKMSQLQSRSTSVQGSSWPHPAVSVRRLPYLYNNAVDYLQ